MEKMLQARMVGEIFQQISGRQKTCARVPTNTTGKWHLTHTMHGEATGEEVLVCSGELLI